MWWYWVQVVTCGCQGGKGPGPGWGKKMNEVTEGSQCPHYMLGRITSTHFLMKIAPRV